MKTYNDFNFRPETCTPQDWLDGWNAREVNVFMFYSGMGSCVGHYPMEEVLGLIENEASPCRQRAEVKATFRTQTASNLEARLPLVVLADGTGGKITADQIQQMHSYYQTRDAVERFPTDESPAG